MLILQTFISIVYLTFTIYINVSMDQCAVASNFIQPSIYDFMVLCFVVTILQLNLLQVTTKNAKPRGCLCKVFAYKKSDHRSLL